MIIMYHIPLGRMETKLHCPSVKSLPVNHHLMRLRFATTKKTDAKTSDLCAGKEPLSLIHVILGLVGSDSCVRSDDVAESVLGDIMSALIGSVTYTVDFLSVVTTSLCLGPGYKYGTASGNSAGPTDLDH